MDRPLHTTQNRVCAWEYASDHPRADAAQVELDVLVTDPDGQELTVPAFQAGPGRWGVRYASPAVGRHRFVTRCSDPTDPALHGRAGVIEVEPGADDGNPLYRHGPLRRVTAGARHLQHADGTPFLWLADTWWMGLVRRLRWPEDFQRLAADRAGKGFSVALLVAGLYPDMPPFDARGANEAGFPWSEGFASLNPAWFDAADRRIEHLVELGMVPAIVGSWGYFMQFAGAGVLRRHWRNLIARYGAYPVVWCIAGEALMPFYTSELWDDLYRARIARSEPPSERLLRHQRHARAEWTAITRYVRSADPYRRPAFHPSQLRRLVAGPGGGCVAARPRHGAVRPQRPGHGGGGHAGARQPPRRLPAPAASARRGLLRGRRRLELGERAASAVLGNDAARRRRPHLRRQRHLAGEHPRRAVRP